MLEICLNNGDLIRPCVVPILHLPPAATDATTLVSGGTGLLVDTGVRTLLITAAHVIEPYFGPSKNRNFVTLIAGSGYAAVDISQWELIALDADHDICTIAIPDTFQPAQMGKAFCKPKQWPCRNASLGEKAFILGFPKAHRNVTPNSINCGTALIAEVVAVVRSRDFILVNEDSDRIITLMPDFKLPEHLGGVSGAPVWIHRDDGWMEPVGILTQGIGTDSAFFAAHLEIVGTDGAITPISYRIAPE